MLLCKLLYFAFIIKLIGTAHYYGGTLQWKPVNPYTNSSTVEIIIYQKHTWALTRYFCNRTLIAALGLYGDMASGMNLVEPNIQCLPSAATCSGTGYATILQRAYCTDFSVFLQSSSGAVMKKINLSRNTNIAIGFYSSSWPTIIRTPSGTAANSWSLVTRINLRQGYRINSSPVIGSVPFVRVQEGQVANIGIPFGDWDEDNDLRCRWASNPGPAGNECGDVCSNLPGAMLLSGGCIITWMAVRRPFDISTGRNSSTYVAAIMMEDFNSTTSSSPLSSVPLQFFITTYRPPTGSCNALPTIIGDRPYMACIGTPINVTIVERIVATVYCAGDSIVEFITSSPLYMTQSSVTQVNGTTNQWYITLRWKATDDQYGYQIFCAAAVDQNGLTSSQHCLKFVVGYSAPSFIRPSVVQGSASPMGTIFTNHSLFTIQTTGAAYRLWRNGTYIQIFNRGNSSLPAWEIDCGYSSYCIYSGNTLIFFVPNATWIPGAQYYILFSSGVLSDYTYCGLESAPITDPTFWTFDVWNPILSSTMTSTSPLPPIRTITTRGLSTTTPVFTLTTTGIVMPSTVTIITATTPTIITTTMTSATIEKQAPTEPKNPWMQPMIIGIAIGALVLLLFVLLFIYLYCTRDKKKNKLTFHLITDLPPIISPPVEVVQQSEQQQQTPRVSDRLAPVLEDVE